MATTTNYSWTTPDDTSLVKDGAAAIRSLGTSIDTTTKALNPSTTLGDIEYRSSTANTNTRLGIGSTGQVLTVAGGVPTWATAGGGAPSFTLLSTTTLSGAASHTVSSLSGYTTFHIVINGATNAGGAAPDFGFRINGDTGANYNSGGFFMDPTGTWSVARVSGYNLTGQTSAQVAQYANIGSAAFNGYFTIQGANSTGVKTFTNAFGYSGSIGNDVRGFIGGGFINNSSVVSSITFFSSGINFSGGTMRIYGSAV